jgi:hypothetical protein
MHGIREFFQLTDFAASQQRSRFHFGTYLKNLSGNYGARAGSQFRQFPEGFGGCGGNGAAPALKSGENGFFGGLFERNRRLCLPG